MSQCLHENLTAAELNEHLGAGAVVVHMSRSFGPHQTYDVVLDHPEAADQPTEADVVLAFLRSVNPAMLEQTIARGARLSEGIGVSALRALAEMVHPAPPG